MGWTKRQLIEQAFDEIGLAPYVFDLTADQLESALRRLDSLAATWNGKGIRIGYPLTSSPQNSDIDTDTNIPDMAAEALFLALANRIAPSYGKVVSPETKANAKIAYDALLNKFAVPPEMEIPGGFPIGAGYKSYSVGEPFAPVVDKLLVGDDSALDFM